MLRFLAPATSDISPRCYGILDRTKLQPCCEVGTSYDLDPPYKQDGANGRLLVDSDAFASNIRPGAERRVLPMLQLLLSSLQCDFHQLGLLQ